jgi:succinate dehydrogenase / fumarate reductase membrane anchor subunit
LFLAAWWHAALGLEVVIQDYVRPEAAAVLLVLAVRLAAAAGALVAVVALVRLVAAA